MTARPRSGLLILPRAPGAPFGIPTSLPTGITSVSLLLASATLNLSRMRWTIARWPISVPVPVPVPIAVSWRQR